MKANPKYQKAHAKVEYAVRTGRMKRQPCSVCGNSKADAHHPTYAKPFQVVWLCRKHHIERHRKTHCVNGHEFTKENTYVNKQGWRSCRECHRVAVYSKFQAKGTPDTPELNRRKTHCPKGHPYSGENLYIDSRGWRGCKICRNHAAGKAV